MVYAVFDFTVQGVSRQAFQYGEDQILLAYPDTPTSWEHQDNGNTFGPNPSEDYTSFVPPAPLRIGTVTVGQRVRGLVVVEVAAGPRSSCSSTAPVRLDSAPNWSNGASHRGDRSLPAIANGVVSPHTFPNTGASSWHSPVYRASPRPGL